MNNMTQDILRSIIQLLHMFEYVHNQQTNQNICVVCYAVGEDNQEPTHDQQCLIKQTLLKTIQEYTDLLLVKQNEKINKLMQTALVLDYTWTGIAKA